MSEEEYNNRIGKINAEISTDRVDADRGHYLLLQKLYLKDRYIEDLQQKVEQLEKEVNEYQKELEKADSITQSCIFQGKQESKISFRNCLNRLEQLENIRKEAIEYVKKNLTIGSILEQRILLEMKKGINEN